MCVAFATFVFGQNFPFPQNVTYPYGITAETPDNNRIQTLYSTWNSSFYEESGTLGRIKFDETQYTVSEGIAYGMLIYVYMSNSTNSTARTRFDKLYNYYKRFSTQGGYLMDWKISGFSSVNLSGSATDADLDVALALALAHKQWGSNGTINYIQETENLLAKIRDLQVDGNNIFKPGHHWNESKNPCYFTTASIGLFIQAQTQEGFTNTRNWNNVYSASHTFLKNSQRNGLWPDWCTASGGQDSRGSNFYWDACRTPWRVAWDYVWFGTTQSKEMCNNSIAFMSAKNLLNNPGSVGAYSNLYGSSYSSVSDQGEGKGNSCFVGGLGAALMVDATKQANLNTFYTYLKNKNETWGYYAPTIQILYLLTMSGNMPNPYANAAPAAPRIVDAETNAAGTQIILSVNKDLTTPASTQASNFTLRINTITQSSAFTGLSMQNASTIQLNLSSSIEIVPGDIITISYTPGTIQSTEGVKLETTANQAVTNRLAGNSTLVDDCEDGDNINSLGGAWFTYNDADDSGTSTVIPLTSNLVEFEMTAGGANSSVKAAKISYTLGKMLGTAPNQYNPFVGIGTQLGAEDTPMDITGSTAISFYHKGSACVLEIHLPENMGANANYDTYAYNVPAHTTWTKVEVPWIEFTQAGWGDAYTLDLTEVYKFQWKVTNTSNSTGELWLDNIVLEGLAGQTSTGPNKTELIAAITTAQDKIDNAVAGTAPGNYPQSAITSLNTAINTAQAVASNTEATQTEVDQAASNLNNAIAIFNAAQITPPNTIIADCEDENMTKLLTYWYSYAAGSSTIVPLASETTPFVMTAGGANGTAHAASVTGQLVNTADPDYESAGIGFALLEPEANYDLTGATGISFYHKGEAVNFSVIISTTEQDAGKDYSYLVPASTAWQLVTVSFPGGDAPSLAQPSWMTEGFTPWDASKVTKLQWQVKDGTARSYAFSIDEVTVMGKTLDLPTTPVSVDKTLLTAAITNAQTTLGAASIGNQPGQYTLAVGMALENAIAAANAVNEDATATQAEVDQATTAMNDAIALFIASVNPAITVDIAALTAKISEANATLSSASIGTAEGQHPQSAANALTTAIATAQALANNPTTQTAVDNMVTTLNNAITTFVNTTNPPVGANTLIADCEDENMTKLLTYWYSYAAGSSTIVPLASETTPFVMTAGGANGTAHAASVTGQLVNTADPDYESAGIGFALLEPEANYDLTGATGISFYHKGEAVNFSVIISTTEQDAGKDYSYLVPASTAWQLVTVSFPGGDAPSLAQPSWMTEGFTPWDASKVTKLQWQVKDGTARSYAFSIDEVTVMGKTLDLPTTPVSVDKTLLTAAITNAQTTLGAASIGNQPGQYTLAVGMALENAIAAANAVNEDATATQAEVDQATTAMNDAIALFIASVNPAITVDIAALTAKISEANATLSSASIGTAEGQHPQSAANALTTAIATAQALANNPTTQTAVNNMVTTLNTAITTFLNTVNPAEGVVDKSSLASTIALAQTTHNAAKEGSSSGEYTVGSKAILQNAITNAQTVHNNTLATQAQVNQAVTTLQNALATFQNSLIGVDKSILQTTIMAAQQKYDNADEGNLVGQYPEGTKQELLYEITIAQSVLASTTATQGQIDLAVTTLQAAMDLFDTQINPATISKDELEALITQAEALHADATHSYPLLETVEFYHAIQAAIEVYENNSLLQAHINNAVADLQAAIERYENSR
ncbi:MAG TPA: glycosyl hydrolase family 8, partial [Bacteroidales bacterium]|nr:glycosyl hydrolase family 8 [Bacteroidales bacterium]